ncbi:MAG: hypothetical protein JW828_12735 [Sedimentisphaerales bacterium]|nr:hypothetical protein [Sedimentisphaerales bacterium]
MKVDRQDFLDTRANLIDQLLTFRNEQGYWEGRLSSSALSTATAVFALAMVDAETHEAFIRRGLDWLRDHQNPDGGWGDTTISRSNLSTTLLCWSALAVEEHPHYYARTVEQAELWLRKRLDRIETEMVIAEIEKVYGSDRTFATPILTMCALAGRIGRGDDVWRKIASLPFELAALPRRMFRRLGLGVVSYALPALIAIGQVQYHYCKPRNPITRWIRGVLRKRTLRILTHLQPDNGGFLEAAPLTSFVIMSLAECGDAEHPAVRKGVEFLRQSMREDGSWPIDTNLATWVTTLTVNALTSVSNTQDVLTTEDRRLLCDWLLDQQHVREHPYTGTAPGGWAWTDLPGGVPDADDTAGALVALYRLGKDDEQVRQAARAGTRWLVNLQNRDGGIPTFCRGWGRLPFDQSCADLTAHALAAWGLWLNEFAGRAQKRIGRAMERAIDFLQRAQREDGSWLPLWFGNENTDRRGNPVYGTGRVLSHLCCMPQEFIKPCRAMLMRGAEWLISVQNADGGWGGAKGVVSSIEETSLAVDGLARVIGRMEADGGMAPEIEQAIDGGIAWLIQATQAGTESYPAAIGLYFARLWYYERLYPIVFAVTAMETAAAFIAEQQESV